MRCCCYFLLTLFLSSQAFSAPPNAPAAEEKIIWDTKSVSGPFVFDSEVTSDYATLKKGTVLGEISGIAVRKAEYPQVSNTFGDGRIQIEGKIAPGIQIRIKPDGDESLVDYVFFQMESERVANAYAKAVSELAQITPITRVVLQPRFPTATIDTAGQLIQVSEGAVYDYKHLLEMKEKDVDNFKDSISNLLMLRERVMVMGNRERVRAKTKDEAERNIPPLTLYSNQWKTKDPVFEVPYLKLAQKIKDRRGNFREIRQEIWTEMSRWKDEGRRRRLNALIERAQRELIPSGAKPERVAEKPEEATPTPQKFPLKESENEAPAPRAVP